MVNPFAEWTISYETKLMPNINAATQSVPVTISFTEQGGCVTPAFWEALRNANIRVTLPTTFSGGSGTTEVKASTLPDNITRIDSEGAIYTPGIVKVELTEQTVTLTTTTAPGVPVTMTFATPGVSDLQNALRNIDFDVQPPESPVYIGPARLASGNIVYNIYRIDDGTSTPWPEVVIRGSGRVFVVPSPSPL